MNSVLDILRVLACAAIFGIGVLAIEILVVYWKNARKGGLLPQHIWLIVCSYLVFAAGAGVMEIQDVGEGFSSHLIFAAVGAALGLVALERVRRHIYAARNSARPK